MMFSQASPFLRIIVIFQALFLSQLMGVHPSASSQERVPYNDEAEHRFLAAVQVFRSQNFLEAHRQFASVYADLPINQRTTAAYVMDGKALSRLGEPDFSDEVLRKFLQKFPSSLYVGDAHYTMGINALWRRDFENALRDFARLLDEHADNSLAAEAETLVRTIVEKISPESQVKRIQLEFSGRSSGDFVAYVLAEKFYAANDFLAAREILETLVRGSRATRYTGRAHALLRQIEGGGSVKIGVLLPLFSKTKDAVLQRVGQEFLAGARLAAEEHNSHPRSYTKVALEIRDTERDPVIASRVIQEMVSDPEIVAIVGPIYSEEVFATAGVANAKGVPLISPTANANGTASVGQYIFQANPDYSARGKAMAQYAIGKRGYRTVAVLAPIDAVGKYMAESFIEEATRLGATILAVEWYGRNTTNLYPQYRSIREKGLIKGSDAILTFSGKLEERFVEKLASAGVPGNVIDSLLEKGGSAKVSAVLGEHGKRIVDSLQIPVTYPDLKLDSLHIPVTSVEAIYIPIVGADEIGIVSSQLVYYNVQAQILGTGDWYDIGELEANRRYANGAIFTSDTYVEPADTTYQHLLERMLETMGVRATNNTLFVFDTMRLLFSVLDKGAITRDQIAKNLAEVRKFKGLHTLISFSERVNNELHILQYKAGKVYRIDGITVDELILPVSP